MSLKQIIQRSQQFNREGIEAELVLPGEPNIYSIKVDLARRSYNLQYFRNMKFRAIIKCFFMSYLKINTPVVIVVRFYVTPPLNAEVSKRDLLKETVPAVRSFELCDYLLSFQEMLHKVIFNSYRQVVKIDAEKYYSAEPRTVFKFMSWANYVMLQNIDSVHASNKGQDKPPNEGLLPANDTGIEAYQDACQEAIR